MDAGSCGAIHGASRAKITKTRTSTTPTAARGLWRAFPTIRRRKEMAAVDTPRILTRHGQISSEELWTCRQLRSLGGPPHNDRVPARVGRPHDQRDHRAAQHDSSNHVQSVRIVAGALADVRDQSWSQHSSESPRCEHQAVDRTDVLRAEIVRSKGWHGPEAAAVTKQYDEAHRGESWKTLEARKNKEQDRLDDQHGEEDPPASDQVREPRP